MPIVRPDFIVPLSFSALIVLRALLLERITFKSFQPTALHAWIPGALGSRQEIRNTPLSLLYSPPENPLHPGQRSRQAKALSSPRKNMCGPKLGYRTASPTSHRSEDSSL